MISESYSGLITKMKNIIRRIVRKKIRPVDSILFLLLLLTVNVVFDSWAVALVIVIWLSLQFLDAWKHRGYNEEF